MPQCKAILWDIDGTLLNFEVAEVCALRACFSEFQLGSCNDAMLAQYSAINRSYWLRLERGEITKQEVLLGRFQAFFSQYGIDPSIAAAFNSAYQVNLGNTVAFHPHALETVRALHGHVLQFAATNGTKVAQENKLARSGLAQLFDGIFISEDIGAEKPSPQFFDAIRPRLSGCPLEHIIIVGDSLTSDMQLGNNVGIRCCWYNPKKRPKPAAPHLDYQIQDLQEVCTLVGLPLPEDPLE